MGPPRVVVPGRRARPAGALVAGLASAAFTLAGPAAAQGPPPPVLDRAVQLLVVTTPGWSATSGTLRRFARDVAGGAWRPQGGPVPVVVGRTGLAWGVGFDAWAGPDEPLKREGDGKSPAGVFPVGTAFGFAPADSARWVKLPWLQLRPTTECVDDTASAHYTAVLDRSSVERVDWSSSERMRAIGVYRLGAVVAYNESPTVRGRGSCVFLHVWGGPASHTAGCTAMDEGELGRLLRWLDPAARPVLLQAPASAYARLSGPWRLPEAGG